MQAVIMAAGRGTRLGKLTDNEPKPLINVDGKPILTRTLEIISPLVKEVIIVVRHLGSKIKNHFGNDFHGHRLIYIEQKIMGGTAGALWQAKPLLRSGSFLVLNGDDLYRREEVAKVLRHPLAMGLTFRKPLGLKYLVITRDKDGLINDWHYITEGEANSPCLMANGVYVLDQRIFDYSPILLSNGEYGLPHTILQMSEEHPVHGQLMDFWVSINYPKDIAEAERILQKELNVSQSR